MKLLILFFLLVALSNTLMADSLKCQKPRHQCAKGQICTGQGCLELCNGVPCPKGYRCQKNDCVKKKSVFG